MRCGTFPMSGMALLKAGMACPSLQMLGRSGQFEAT